MLQVGVQEAKARLARLVELVEGGERVLITRDGNPVVEIVRCDLERVNRTGGQWNGKASIADDFDAPLPELEPDWPLVRAVVLFSLMHPAPVVRSGNARLHRVHLVADAFRLRATRRVGVALPPSVKFLQEAAHGYGCTRERGNATVRPRG